MFPFDPIPRDGGATMSTVSDRPPAKSAEEPDPFRYGWRYISITRADGTEDLDRVPLTLEDVLHPEVGDIIVQSDPHDRDRLFKSVFETRLMEDPTAVVLSDCQVDFNLPGVKPLAPDDVVFLGVRRRSAGQASMSRRRGAAGAGGGGDLARDPIERPRAQDGFLPPRQGALVPHRRRHARSRRRAPDRTDPLSSHPGAGICGAGR